MLKMKKCVILKKEEFDYVTEYECYRTDRSNISFSLISFSLYSKKKSKNPDSFFNFLNKRLRTMDVVGFFDKSHLCILLPSTSYQEAELFLKKIQESIKNYSKIIQTQEVFTYPGKWVNERNIKKQIYSNDNKVVYAGNP
jgi:hypothetical protein